MKTATKVVQLPGLGLNAYEVEGRPWVSMSEIVKATRNNDDTRPLTKWLSGGAKQSDANGSHGFPQGDSGDAFECNVPRPDGSHITAKLFSPQVAWHWVLHDLTSTKAAIVERALKLVQVVGAAGFETMCQEVLGLRATVEENLHGALRLQADLEKKAPDIQRLKLALYQVLLPEMKLKTIYDLPKNDIHHPIFNVIKTMINESVYRRLDEGVLDGLNVVQKRSPRKYGNRKASKYSCLTDEAHRALKPVINAHIVALKQIQHLPATADDIRRVVTALDSVYPRYN